MQPRQHDLRAPKTEGILIPQPARNAPPAKISTPGGRTGHTSSACVSCQRMRRRCDGAGIRPCASCVRLNITCVPTSTSDRRRKNQRQREKKDQDLLHKLIGAIRTWDDTEVDLLQRELKKDGSTAHLERLLLPKLSSHHHLAESSASTGGQNDSFSSATESTDNHSFEPGDPDSRTTVHMMTRDSNSERVIAPGAVRSFHNLPMSCAIISNHWPPHIQRQQLGVLAKPEYLCLPLILEANADPLTSSLLGFLSSARSRIHDGESIKEVLSMGGVDIELFFRARRPGDPHTVSTWACEVVKTFPQFSFPVRINALHCISSFLRWLIFPCQETWLQMSTMTRPVREQILIPHVSMFADICHVPQLRVSQLKHGRQIQQFITRPDSADCNWPFRDEDCIETVAEVPKRLSPAFIKHVDDPRNWSLHHSVVDCFPELMEPGNRIALHDDRAPGRTGGNA